ncbi:ABC transporter substrate-binding protein [Aliarcobacter butzleri]|uniref:ABC transporter substrate-binding protein n=2 Tax=Aliarcobacter butzleri TaxID=28197 RepID=UPI000658B5A8|nr:helical backbone metal receptor [Aliarcobacter butzleri]KLE05072.1 iron ABC transporter substrate-binding protein [Aliarcobacter butzleri L353]MCG3712285.1 helical backbone metal receptor [Aliarcobacter butzleri]MCT7546950.1 helical backbone metal receptor [Aliarcobacter butzleri]MCT7603503.1 helical backbone metal receptor [Aliarcobacter butzleri]
MKKLFFIVLFSINLFAETRVITLSPAINEIVFALDEGKNVVANTKFCDFPEESKSIPKIGSYNNISLEKVLKLNPTVVITQNYDEKLNSNLEALNIKLKVYKTDSLADIKYSIENLGEYFNKIDKAKELNQSIDEALKELENIVTNQKILIVFSPQQTLSNDIYVAGNYVYFEDIINASSNKNAYKSESKAQPVLNTEKIINLNPDIIVLLTPFLEDNKNEQENIINLWRSLPINASKNSNIYTIDKLYAGISSHRVALFIKDFKKILENVRDKKL